METRYDELVANLRNAARPDRPVPDVALDYTDTVRRGAYLVTDEQVDALSAAGLSEDEIFELTVAAAAGAGLHRLDAGLKALR